MIRHENAYKRPLVYLLAIGFLILVVLTRLYETPFRWAQTFVGNVIYTIQEGTYGATTSVRDNFTRYFFLMGLHDENKHLKQEIERLYGEIHRLQEEEIKAQHLRRLLKFTQASPLKFIPAEVIGRESGSLSATLMINKGTAEGVQVNAGVITPRGVVGHIIHAASHHAQVLLMTDTRSALSAIVQRTREEGMVHGAGRGKGLLKYFPPMAKAEKGDTLITSGLEGRFPKGLRVGHIENVEVMEDDLFLKIMITPEVPFENLEEVLVLAPPESPSEAPPPIASQNPEVTPP